MSISGLHGHAGLYAHMHVHGGRREHLFWGSFPLSCSLPGIQNLPSKNFPLEAAASRKTRKAQWASRGKKSVPSLHLAEKLLLNSMLGPDLDLKIYEKTNAKQMPIRALTAEA